MWEAIGRFVSRYALFVIGLWIAVAVVGNLFVPQIETTAGKHARGFLPADAPVNVASTRVGTKFGDGVGGNVNYLVLESDHQLGAPEKAFYDRLLTDLRADRAHLDSAMDMWSDPLTAQGVLSADGKAVYAMLRVGGELGSAQANMSLAAIRRTVASQHAPPALHTYVTGPGATIADEFSAIDKQLLLMTCITVVLITILLFWVYRSAITAAIPLLTVGLGLAVARPLVSFLGEHDLVEVSIFSVALLSAMLLGAATDYGIFLIGRYHEARRSCIGHEEALSTAYRSVAPVILASAFTIAVALACLTFAKVGMLRSAGLSCAAVIMVGMLVSLTVLPALIGLAGRRGLAQPRAMNRQPGRRWRRIGTVVARWPGPVLVASVLVLAVFALPLAGLRLGFNELVTQPDNTPANRGYQAMDRHFPPNRLLPETVSIEVDHDLRNPAGVIAIERVTRKIMEIPGVTMVQSASRPAGSIPDQATFTSQAGILGDRLDDGIAKLRERIKAANQLEPMLDQFSQAISQLQTGLSGAVKGIGRLGSSVDAMDSGMRQLQDILGQVSGYADPLRNFTNGNPNCPNDLICSLVLKIVQPVDSAIAATGSLVQGASQLGPGTSDIAATLSGAEQSARTMRAALTRLGSMNTQLADVVSDTRAMFSGLTEYLQGLRQDFENSGGGGYYLPQRAWQDVRFQRAAATYFPPDGRMTRMLVYGEGQVFGADGARRAPEIAEAVKAVTKEGTLAGSSVNVVGFGSGTAELRGYVKNDFILLAAVALAAVFLIVVLMLGSPVAAAVVIGTVIVSYLSALGISDFIWHDLLGKDMHWAVPSIALIALVAVGSDYNLLLIMRMREEVFIRSGGKTGLSTAMIRTFGGTGGVVTTAGIVFGITMFAMLSSDVISIKQVGTTIGVGLIIDTLIVRALVVPSIAGVLGRWFWWSPPMSLFKPLMKRTARPII